MSDKIQIYDKCKDEKPRNPLIYDLRPSQPGFGVDYLDGAVDVLLVSEDGKTMLDGKIIRLNPDGTFYRYNGVGADLGISLTSGGDMFCDRKISEQKNG